MALETVKFDVQNHLRTRAARIAYLEAVLEDGDPGLIATALGDIARAVFRSSRAKPA
jgi:probable addiction module antidote protein